MIGEKSGKTSLYLGINSTEKETFVTEFSLENRILLRFCSRITLDRIQIE